MIETEERVKVLEAQVDKMTELARESSDKAGAYERGLRAIMKHLEMILGEQSRMSTTYNLAEGTLRGRFDNKPKDRNQAA